MTEQAQQAPQTADSPQATGRALGIITIALVLINACVYFYQGLHGISWIDPTPEQLLASGGNVAMLTLTGDAWRLVMSVFVHGGLVHLLMNMYMLLLLGSLAERQFGRVGLLMLFLAGGVAASCASAWWQSSHTLGTDFLGRPLVRLTVSVGASGAIMAIAGALLAAHTVRAWYGSDHRVAPEANLSKSLWQVVAINVGMGFLIPGVDNAAHIGGVAAGLIMGALIQYAVEVADSWLEVATRIGMPPLLAAACAWALLHGNDWADLREIRALQDQQKRDEMQAEADERAVAARRQAIAEERERLPTPSSDDAARGREIKFGESGTSFALSADGKTAYAVDHHKNQISEIDLKRGVVDKTIAGPKVPIKKGCGSAFCGSPAAADIAVLRHRPLALVTSMQKDAVVFVDLALGQPSTTVTVGKTPHAILLADDDRRAYVHNVGDNSISVIDVEAATVVQTLRLPKADARNSRSNDRLPMWLSADGARLFAASGTAERPQVHTFDTTAMTHVGSEDWPYEIKDVAQPSGSTGPVVALSDRRLHVIDEDARADKAAWAFCYQLVPTNLAATRMTEQSAYMAVADRQPYNGRHRSTVYVANARSLVTIGRYPVSGVVTKLMLTDNASHVYAVTSDGDFVILDTGLRVNRGELLCD